VKAIFAFMLRWASAFTAAGLVWFVSLVAFSQGFFTSSVFGLLGGVASYYSVKNIQLYRDAKQYGLTRKEYQFIKENLAEAKQKILRLQRAFVTVRRFGNAQEHFEILKTARRIYANTKKEPKRFFQAESFYYKHLDSLVEIVEKYAYLSQQQVKSREMHETMRDSRFAIISLGQTVNKDLQVMLRDDVDTLHFELDVAKKTIQEPKNKNGRFTS
jgi:5-bromo-4-chloroindolyl phosphate hydrolysis protein